MLQRLSIAQKLLTIVAVNVFVLAIVFLIFVGSLQLTDAARSFVGAEGLWSKSQKSAVNNLIHFALFGDAEHLARYESDILGPLSIRFARLEMDKAEYDPAIVSELWVRGGVDENDVPGMVGLYRNFGEVGYLKRAVTIWLQGDAGLQQLIAVAEDVKVAVQAGANSSEKRNLIQRLYDVDAELTQLEIEFSQTMGDAARWLQATVVWAGLLLILFLASLAFWVSWRLIKDITGNIIRLDDGARALASGNMEHRIDVQSSDELGSLAASFNNMIDQRRVAAEGLAIKATELQAVNLDLAGKNKQLHTLYAAEAASEAKTRFLSTMSHEIRTPLNGMLGLLELVDSAQLPKDQAENIKLMRHSGETLQRLINDILDVARIESGQINIVEEVLNLALLRSRIYGAIGSTVRKKNINYRFRFVEPIPMNALTDAGILEQILLNLVANAIKFTPAEGSVKVFVSSPKQEKVLRFEVQDSGVGIAQEAQDRIFHSFEQAENSTTREFGGSGLGLYISKGLVEQLGGRIACESEPGQGSRFWFDIPLKIAEKNEIEQAPIPEAAEAFNRAEFPPGEPLRILVAEDNLINQKVFGKQLSRYNCTVDMSDDGEQALEKWQTGNYQLILTDINMPKLSGQDLTRRIRAQELAESKTPVIIIGVTASAQQSVFKDCLDAGMNDYLVKPLSLTSLDQTLREWICP
ncbi:MAG: ATP-binding protein [Oceanococcus sp.]